MQIEAQQFLRLAEQAGQIAAVDIEATGLRGDYNSVLVVSIKPYGQKVTTFKIQRPGQDQKVVREAGEMLEGLDAWITYYGKGFDLPMLNTRRLVWGLPPIDKRHHIDMYYTLKSNLNTSRRSQGHLLSWLGVKYVPSKGEVETTAEMPQKMTVSAEMWNKVLAEPRKYIPVMVDRCESDVEGLLALYDRTKHLILDIRR